MCPKCGLAVAPEMNFCPNCGKRLKEKPASTDVWGVLVLLIFSLLLPPFGIGLTIRYLKSTDPTARVLGVISLVLTIGVVVYAVWAAVSIYANVSQLVNRQLNLPPGGF